MIISILCAAEADLICPAITDRPDQRSTARLRPNTVSMDYRFWASIEFLQKDNDWRAIFREFTPIRTPHYSSLDTYRSVSLVGFRKKKTKLFRSHASRVCLIRVDDERRAGYIMTPCSRASFNLPSNGSQFPNDRIRNTLM